MCYIENRRGETIEAASPELLHLTHSESGTGLHGQLFYPLETS